MRERLEQKNDRTARDLSHFAWRVLWCVGQVLAWFRQKIARVTGFLSLATLGLCYLVIISPIAAAMRVLGRDVLRLRRDTATCTYWRQRATPTVDKTGMLNPF